MPCLLCQYFQPIEPEDHKRLRLSGNCQHSCGDSWDFNTAVTYVRRHRRVLDGFCRLNPQPLARSCADVCGQIAFHLPYWVDGIHGPEDRSIHTLVDWSREQMSILQDGTWDRRQLDKFREEMPELKRQLKIARERSAARLAELKKLRSAKPHPTKRNLKPLELVCDNVVENIPQATPPIQAIFHRAKDVA